MLGTNDLRNRWGRPEQEATAPAMIAGLRQMVLRAHTRGIRIFGGTLTPFENETFLVGAWTPAREAVRQAVNAWIRESGAFDAVIDLRSRTARSGPSNQHAADLRLWRPLASERPRLQSDGRFDRSGVVRLIRSRAAGTCALLNDRKQESPQRHGDTEKKAQVFVRIVFSVSPCLCGDSCFLSLIK